MRKKLTVLILILVWLAMLLVSPSKAEDTIWVVCRPGSSVNIRSRASGRSEIVGYADPGDCFETDGITSRGFIHVYASIEAMEGWISLGYVVYDEPVRVDEMRTIEANGKVKVREKVGGKRIGWLHPGDRVMVYYIAEWCVTSAGYVRFEFIGGE